jgi:hypothetical protein
LFVNVLLACASVRGARRFRALIDRVVDLVESEPTRRPVTSFAEWQRSYGERPVGALVPAAFSWAARRSRVDPRGVMALAVVVVAFVGLWIGVLGGGPGSAGRVSQNATLAATRSVDLFAGAPVNATETSLHLTPATAPPQPAPASVQNEPPLVPHEVFGFAPYWTLDEFTAFDVKGLTTIAYFAVGVNSNGTLDQSGPGWDGYESQQLVDLITRAHAAGDRVVLTVNCFSQSALADLTSSPAAARTLSAELIAAIEAKNLDGVNLDFEGTGSADQAGLTNLVSMVTTALHAIDPNWQVTMDTYASSAGDPNGFYNIKALAPFVDGFFVMAYQLNLEANGGPGSPLTDTTFPNATTVAQYAATVTPKKVILGLATFGYDWPTTSGALGAPAVGTPSVITYGQEVASGHPMYWDPVTDTGWTSFVTGGQWHQAFFEDPQSLYMAAQLAQSHGLAGVGEWALGFDGNSPTIIEGLDGFAPAEKVTTTGPSTTPGSTPPSTNATTLPSLTVTGVSHAMFTGTFDGQSVVLEKVPFKAPGSGSVSAGTLKAFSTDDSSLSCLATGTGLPVWKSSAHAVRFYVTAQVPTNCASQTFTFVEAAVTPDSSTSTTTQPGSSTPTTRSGSSTTSRTSLPPAACATTTTATTATPPSVPAQCTTSATSQDPSTTTPTSIPPGACTTTTTATTATPPSLPAGCTTPTTSK